MTRLRCKKCDHVWNARTRVPKLCPFCGAENSLEDSEIKTEFVDVDELLR